MIFKNYLGLLSALTLIKLCTSNLKLVQVIFRHGISNPEDTYPNDPYKNDSFWPTGRGRLTQEGMEAQFNLGRSIASRYEHFSDGRFKLDDVLVISSDYLKTIASASTFLRGLFGLNDTTEFDDNLIKVISCQDDNILRFCKQCSKHQQLENEVLFRYSVRNALQNNQYVFEYMSSNSGLNIKSIGDFSQLYSTLYYEKFSNIAALPNWADKLFESGALDRIVALMLRLPTSTNELKRLKCGPLLEILVANMSRVVNELSPNISKLQVFSGHAETVFSLLDCLELHTGRSDQIPPFSSAVILELHQNPITMYFHVEIFSNIGSKNLSEFNKLWIPTCAFNCPWSDVHRILNPYLIVDFDLECETAVFPWNALLSAFILLAAFPILLVFFVKLLEKRRTEEEFSPLLNSHKIF